MLKFIMLSFAIWGAGDAVNEAINGRYSNAVLSTAIGMGYLLYATKGEKKGE